MNNPRDKARELVNSFIKYSESGIDNSVKTLKSNAKKCALIAVDEIIDVLDADSWGLEMDKAFDKYYYWKDVREEINNL